MSLSYQQKKHGSKALGEKKEREKVPLELESKLQANMWLYNNVHLLYSWVRFYAVLICICEKLEFKNSFFTTGLRGNGRSPLKLILGIVILYLKH